METIVEVCKKSTVNNLQRQIFQHPVTLKVKKMKKKLQTLEIQARFWYYSKKPKGGKPFPKRVNWDSN
jgi:hypothetical protein